jgi:hypothetical protein
MGFCRVSRQSVLDGQYQASGLGTLIKIDQRMFAAVTD